MKNLCQFFAVPFSRLEVVAVGVQPHRPPLVERGRALSPTKNHIESQLEAQ